MKSLVLSCFVWIAIAAPPGARVGDRTDGPELAPPAEVSADAAAPPPAPAESPLSDQELREIIDIRREVGPLDGPLFEDREFASQLRETFGAGQVDPPPTTLIRRDSAAAEFHRYIHSALDLGLGP